jgi:hypothetical protein
VSNLLVGLKLSFKNVNVAVNLNMSLGESTRPARVAQWCQIFSLLSKRCLHTFLKMNVQRVELMRSPCEGEINNTPFCNILTTPYLSVEGINNVWINLLYFLNSLIRPHGWK